jgi:uncharacterized membrane protein YoaK (UPF0700 family)
MFRHQGKKRAFIHNLRLAALLSFVAGIVNISGVLSVQVLTTNVTGHFAFFAEQILLRNYSGALHFLAFILSFFLGAFFASILTALSTRRNINLPFKWAIGVEMAILAGIGLGGISAAGPEGFPFVACLLLFAMGIQNSLVTQISHATVRTTHLTGLFTDLGIDISQLLFDKGLDRQAVLKRRIRLRLSIVVCFFGGCILGGILFSILGFKTLLIGAALLLIALA